MGLILDSSVLIAGERRGETVRQVVLRLRAIHGPETETSVSAITIVEPTHGIYRARESSHREHRRDFVEELCTDMQVHPVTLAIAQLAGRIEGEQAARGVVIAIEDLVIGATALHLGFDVATLNVRHLQQIPGLRVAKS